MTKNPQDKPEKKKCTSCLAGFSREDILGNCTCDSVADSAPPRDEEDEFEIYGSDSPTLTTTGDMLQSEDERRNIHSVAPTTTGDTHYVDSRTAEELANDANIEVIMTTTEAPTDSSPIEEWEVEMESDFNKRFGFGMWPKNGSTTDKIYSSDVLEWCRRLILSQKEQHEKQLQERVPMHLYNKHREEMFQEGKAQGLEIGHTEATAQIVKLIKGMVIKEITEMTGDEMLASLNDHPMLHKNSYYRDGHNAALTTLKERIQKEV